MKFVAATCCCDVLQRFIAPCVPALTKKCKLDPVHTGPVLHGHQINLRSLKTSMTLKFVIILQTLIKAYRRKSGKSKYDRKLTELDVETTRIWARVNGVLIKVQLKTLFM